MSVWRQTSIWNNAVVLLIGPLGIRFNEPWIKIQQFSYNGNDNDNDDNDYDNDDNDDDNSNNRDNDMMMIIMI